MFLSVTITMAKAPNTRASKDFEAIFKPQRFENIDWYKNDRFDTYHKALGKESSLEGNIYYYEVSGIKFPISLHKKANSQKIEKIYYRILKNKMTFKQLRAYMKKNGFTKDKSNTEFSEYRTFIHSDKKIKIKFLSVTQKLYSVEKWF